MTVIETGFYLYLVCAYETRTFHIKFIFWIIANNEDKKRIWKQQQQKIEEIDSFESKFSCKIEQEKW